MIKLGRIVLKKLKVINKINQFSFDTNKKIFFSSTNFLILNYKVFFFFDYLFISTLTSPVSEL
jgi:hypothetical protein